jgi:hypothetical protein
MTASRRRRGEDGISFEHRGRCRDPERHRHCPGLWRGEITLGYTGDGKRPPQGQRQDQGRRGGQTPRPAPPARQGHPPQDRLHPLHRPAGRLGLARPRPGRPLTENGQEEPERPGADPDNHRRPQAPRPDRRRRAAGTGHDGCRVLHRGGDHGAPRAQARHPARGSQRPGQPKRRNAGRRTQGASKAARPSPSPWTRPRWSSPPPAPCP